MNNLLKAESYKLMHNRSFWGLLICSFVLGSVMLIDSRRVTDGMLNASVYNTPLLYFLIILFAVSFIGEDFGNRTLHCFVCGGHKRMSILFAKTLLYLLASEVILAGPLFLHGLIGRVIGGVGGLTGPDFLMKAGLVSVAILAMGMLPLTIAIICKDIGKTLTISLAVFFLMIFALNVDYSGGIAAILPMGQLRLLALNERSISKMAVLKIDVVWIFLLYSISYISLRHSDLR